MSRRRTILAFAMAVCAVALSAVLFACSQTPTSVPIRTFERAQKVDVVCLRVFGDNAPEALRQEACAPVPPNVNGGNLDNQLFALVTQTTRGEVAVVNLSAGNIIDQRHAIPGLNFLPIGANPTDIASTPDGRMVFVSSAEPNKFAIYGIPGHRILGDQASRRDPDGAIALSSWPVCTLPQRPGSLAVVPRRAKPGVTVDGGTFTDTTDIAYELVAVLPGDRTQSAKVVTLDPRPFLRGSPRKTNEGQPLDDYGDGPVLAPGQLGPCPITAAMELSGEEALPTSVHPGSTWDDGVPWVDGGVDLTCETPVRASSCGLPSCACVTASTGAADAGDAGNDAGASVTACEADAGKSTAEEVLDLGPLDPPQPVAIALDDQTLYVADDGVPLIHVIDLSTPGAPRELPPFVMTSTVEPTRVVSIRDIAISPPTHEFKRFLYAVDRKEGSIAIFDVTDPVNAARTPMLRPHPELNPFQPPDRISFASPVVSVAFARHEVPIARIAGRAISNPSTGLLCNPNPNVDPNAPETNGAQYRADSQDVDFGLGPRPTPGRLRGVFAFATLSSGQVVAIDVDDWDAPCRRPVKLTGELPTDGTAQGVLAVPQPNPAAGDVDPYHAPDLSPTPLIVSQEIFFPVSAPHRARSNYFLRDDVNTGKHIPFLASTPSITAVGTIAPPLVGPGSESTPRMRPTVPRPGAPLAGTEDVGILFSLDTPDVHFDQDWAVTYEGALPGFDGLPAAISTTDGYATLVLSQSEGRFCAKGVEDWAVGRDRAAAIDSALTAAGRAPYPEPLESKLVDYVQIADELLAPGDPYWAQPDLAEPNGCWDDPLDTTSTDPGEINKVAGRRFDFCMSEFATAGEQNKNRDFPILEAYDDHLVIGRFAPGAGRDVATGPTNAPYMKVARCCFHHQFTFRIRTGAQWATVGSIVGSLNHMTTGAGNRCVPSCDPNAVLRNGRAPSLPYGDGDFAPFRDSPLAMRNPSFSFFIQNGYVAKDTGKTDKRPDRDMTYHFQTRGSFQALVINLAAQTAAVTPQSMRFIETLGQLAVVDGASQGLVLIDLAGVGIARAPYF
jgi:hypothetical protein